MIKICLYKMGRSKGVIDVSEWMVETAILRIAYSNEIFFGKMIALGVD
jgi:hypothetical protein